MTKRISFVVLAIIALIAVCGAVPSHAKETLSIAAVVNDDAISMRDVEDRMKLVMTSSGLPNNPEIRAKILPQVLDGLIEEQLKLQEARRHKIEISAEQVAEGFKTIAGQNNFSAEQFAAVLKKAGISKNTLDQQIKAQLAWNEVIKTVLKNQVDVSPQDVDLRVARLKEKIGQTEYMVAQIYLPFDESKRANELRQFAGRMAKELQAKKAPFGPVAAQFSKAAGADKGGTLGWIQLGYLEPKLDQALQKLEEGGVSDPIETSGGLYLLNLQKKRTITEDSIPPRDELMNQIGFERLDRVQQRALLDLKGSAFIDRRV